MLMKWLQSQARADTKATSEPAPGSSGKTNVQPENCTRNYHVAVKYHVFADAEPLPPPPPHQVHWEEMHTMVMSHEVLVAAPLTSLTPPHSPSQPRCSWTCHACSHGAVPASVRGPAPAPQHLQGGFFLSWRSLLKPPHLTPSLKEPRVHCSVSFLLLPEMVSSLTSCLLLASPVRTRPCESRLFASVATCQGLWPWNKGAVNSVGA